MSQTIESLGAARAAAAGGQWRAAYASYLDSPDDDLAPTDLEAYAEAAWWSGKPDHAIELRERAFTAFLAAGDSLGAARVALALSWDQQGRGAFAVSQGWFAKAERLAKEAPESREYAHVLLNRGFFALEGGADVTAAVAELERAYELAKRVGDTDVQAMALVGKGSALVHSGRVDEGLALLDEATAAAISGEVRPFATGLIYCCTISSCQNVGDFRRAAEWSEAANRWCDRLDVSGFPGVCRVHHAQILRLRGDWPKAEEQAVTACAELQNFDRMVTGSGFYEIGEIRRRRGDFAAAIEAYTKADELGADPQPGLALVRLAEGKVEAAAAAIKRVLADIHEPLRRLRYLPAQIEIAVAAGDFWSARDALGELEKTIDAYKIGGQPAPAFDAGFHLANGQIRLAEGDAEGASRCLRRAREEWQKVGAPYEIAQARTLLGIAYRRQGDEDGAMAEFEAALAGFERLGAKLDEERVKELLGRLETRRTFLFTDIVDSTKLLETLGDDKWKKLLARHDQLLRERIVETGGEVIKQTGDGFFASFDHPKAAVDAAIAIQRALDSEIVAPDVRIGIHTGGAFQTEASFTDYGGQGVHTAARIGAAAAAREILVSRDTIEGILRAFRVSEERAATLKGFEQPVDVVSVDWR